MSEVDFLFFLKIIKIVLLVFIFYFKTRTLYQIVWVGTSNVRAIKLIGILRQGNHSSQENGNESRCTKKNLQWL